MRNIESESVPFVSVLVTPQRMVAHPRQCAENKGY